MRNQFKKFSSDQDGAISVDWVVLSAAIVGLAAGTILAIQAATVALATDSANGVANQPVGTQASSNTNNANGG